MHRTRLSDRVAVLHREHQAIPMWTEQACRSMKEPTSSSASCRACSESTAASGCGPRAVEASLPPDRCFACGGLLAALPGGGLPPGSGLPGGDCAAAAAPPSAAAAAEPSAVALAAAASVSASPAGAAAAPSLERAGDVAPPAASPSALSSSSAADGTPCVPKQREHHVSGRSL